MSLQPNQSVEERIKASYAVTMESNQKTTQELQAAKEVQKLFIEKLQRTASMLQDKTASMEKNYKEPVPC